MGPIERHFNRGAMDVLILKRAEEEIVRLLREVVE